MPRFLAASMIAWIVGAAAPTTAFGQSSSPGPYVIDIRGAMSGAPGGAAFYPPVGTEITVPRRAFGFGAGGHLYPFHLGVARVGLGVDVMRARGTTPSTSGVRAVMAVTTLAPQVSFNFGAREGWSYLSGGYGLTQTRGEVTTPASGTVAGRTDSLERRMPTVNIGGGARWFLREHVAVGFDVRFHRLHGAGATGSKQIVGFSVGLSVR